jgi:ribosome-associated protein
MRAIAASRRKGGNRLASEKRPKAAGGGKSAGGGGDRPRIHSSHTVRAGDRRKGEGAARGEGVRPALPKPKRAKPTPLEVRRAAAKPKLRTSASAAASDTPKTKKTRTAPTPGAVSLASDDARSIAIAIAVAALEKKAVGLEILDVAGKVDYADFLVLMTGRSDRQVVALAQGIEEALLKANKRPLSVEGLPHANWVLMDFGDVVVHVFQDDARSLYDIDGLWMDARRIPVPMPDNFR